VKKSMLLRLSALLLCLCALTGCAAESSSAWADSVPVEVELEDEAVAMAELPAAMFRLQRDWESLSATDAASEGTLLKQAWRNSTVPSGMRTERNDSAVIDYSNTGDGYVMVRYTAPTQQRLKARVIGPTTTYTYNLQPGQWTAFPLSDGSGDYQVTVYENVTGTKYAVKLSASFGVTLKDEFAPFLRPNQYVDYTPESRCVAKAAELTEGISDPLKKVEKVYDFVVQTLTYDTVKAQNLASTYLPVLDTVLTEKKGICFDYAALMAAMLRSQNIPCKLVVGYAGTAYHAWISVWTEETGWVDGVIFFDGTSWKRMDPTFASSGKQSAQVLEYIGDGSNYTEKYLY